MVQSTSTHNIIRWIVRINLYHLLLLTVLFHMSAGRPITNSLLPKASSESKSVQEIRKKVKSRVARHTSQTQLAWREVYLHSRTGYNLAVNEAGEVYGARDFTTDCSILRHSEDAGLVVLQAMSSERFLTINMKGELTTTPTRSERDLLEEHVVHHGDGSYYIMYKSHIYRRKNWYVGVDNSGRPIRHRYRARAHHSHRNGELFTLGAHPTPVVVTADVDELMKR